MAMTPSQLSIIVSSKGVADATMELDKLAKAAASVDAETKSFVIAQANLQNSQKKTTDATKQTSQALIEQKRDYVTWQMAGQSAMKQANDAIKIYNQTTKDYSNLWKQMDSQKLLEQTQQYKLYKLRIDEANKALKTAAALEKAHGDALEMNKKFDARTKSLQNNTEVIKMNARGISEQEFAMIKAHEQASKMNDAFDKKAKRLQEVNRHGSIWNNTLKSMAVAATAYLGVNFAAGIIKQADAWVMMQSKLQLATGSMASAQVVQKDLYDLAQKLRIPLEDSAKLYTRMAHPMMMMGKTSKDTMEMVESLGTALKLSGATGQEASSAMLQFSQSMNAGRLNGGEFNSIAEASPNILRAIETELRRTGQWGEHTTETLKKMGSEGKISSELLARSLQNALPQMRKDFETLPLTFDGAMERLKNSWLKAVGEMGQNTQFTKEFAKSLASLEESLPRIANALGVAFNFVAQNLQGIIIGISSLVGLGFGAWVYSARESLLGLATVMRTMTASALAFMATPIGMAITAITVAVGAGVYAYNSYTTAQEDSKKASENLNKISPDTVKSIEAEYEAALKQYKILFKIKDLKDDLAAQGQVTNIDKAYADVTELAAKLQAAINRGDKDNIAIYEGKMKIATAEISRLKTLDDTTKAIGKVNAAEAERQANAKRVQEMFDKYADKGEKRDKELAKLKELTLTESERVSLIAKINEKYADKTAEKSINNQVTNIDRVNKLLEEQNSLNKEWEQDGLKKLSVGEKFRIQVLSENDTLMKLLASGKVENKLMTDKQRLQILTEISTNDEAIARSKIVEAQQKSRELSQADSKRINKAQEELASEEEKLAVLQRQLDLGEQTNIAKQQQSVIEAELALSTLIQTENFGAEFVLAKKVLETRQKTLGVMQKLEAEDDSKKLAEKYEADYQAANKKIADGLYNAIGKGGESAIKKLIQDIKSWFARLVLSPIIDPISKIGASIISPNAASAGGMGNALSGLSSAASSVSSFLNPMTWGSTAATALSDGIFNVGASMGSEFMMSVSSAMGGGTVSGLAGTVGSALSGIATVAPYLAAAALLYKGLSMGEKQKTGTTVTGNLGTDNLSRNVAWTQSGGFLRGDRSGTWSYGLKDSTAIQDGKAYTDPANATSDKALLNQLNTMYDAVKTSTAAYASALGLNAEDIKARADAINFAFGKDAQETASNINKAFEEVANTIADSLLGELKQLANVNESSSQTLVRLSTDLSTVNSMFKALGYATNDLSVAGVKSTEAIIALFGGLDKFQSIASDYYDKFYSESEKTQVKVNAMTKSLQDLGIELPSSRAAFRELVEAAQKAGNNELYVSLMKLSSAFAEITDESTKAAEKLIELPQTVRDTFDVLSKDVEKWLSLRNQAASLKDSIDEAMGVKKDPATRIKQLWDAMASDVTPEQKLQLAGELKDLVLNKYQIEKESIQKLIDFGRQLRGHADNLKVGGLSPLTMTEKLAEAQRQYQTTLSKAQGGDVTAQGMLQDKADTYLQLAQTALASSSGYQEIFNNVTNSLDILGVEAMSSGEQANLTAASQLAELQRIRDFAAQTELTATNYYRDSLEALTKQLNVMDKLYTEMGVMNGVMSNIASLPAEIAAAIRGQVGGTGNQEFVNSLYNSYAGKFGSQIDLEGFNYWMSDVAKFGREYTTDAFRNSVAIVNSAPAVPVANEVASLKSDIAVLVEEIKGLRTDGQTNTGAIVEATIMSSNNNASVVSTAITTTAEQSSWKETTVPTIN